jgi:putative membrane protein
MAVEAAATELLANGAGWGPGPWWPVFPLFWLVVLGFALFAVLRFRRGGGWRSGRAAEDILAERYARGDISIEEYRERLSVLKETSS